MTCGLCASRHHWVSSFHELSGIKAKLQHIQHHHPSHCFAVFFAALLIAFSYSLGTPPSSASSCRALSAFVASLQAQLCSDRLQDKSLAVYRAGACWDHNVQLDHSPQSHERPQVELLFTRRSMKDNWQFDVTDQSTDRPSLRHGPARSA